MGLYFLPPPVFIGSAQPYDAAPITPPISGPLPQNPPFNGGAKIAAAVLMAWLPPPPAPPAAINLDPPVAGPTPQNPPFMGGAEIPEAVLVAWLPPPPQSPVAVLLEPPIGGPAPQAPPFVGGARVPWAVEIAWLPPAPQPSTAPPLVFQPPPVTTPPFAGGARFTLEAQSWWYQPPVAQAPQKGPLSPPISGPAPQAPPSLGAYQQQPVAVTLGWLPGPPAASAGARLAVFPVPPDNPPFMGGAAVPYAVQAAWLPPPPAPIKATLRSPPVAGPAPQNPPILGARAPAAISISWLPPAPMPEFAPFVAFEGFAPPPPSLVVNLRYVATARSSVFVGTAKKPKFTVMALQPARDFSPALAGTIEGEVGTFDFDPRLPAGVTITGVTSITSTVHYGADASPQNIVSGAAQVVTSPNSGLASRAVAQVFAGGVAGTTYLLVCLVTCSDGVSRSMETHLPFYLPT